jgi:hypothetical protein
MYALGKWQRCLSRGVGWSSWGLPDAAAAAGLPRRAPDPVIAAAAPLMGLAAAEGLSADAAAAVPVLLPSFSATSGYIKSTWEERRQNTTE